MPKQKLSKTKQCLLLLAEQMKEQGDLWVNLMIGASHPLYKRTFFGGGTEAVRRRRHREAVRAYRQHIALLKRQQWIQLRHIGNTIQIALTTKGERIAFKEQMKNASSCKTNECIIVIFDIPEQEKIVRQEFRRLLKECGFKKLQQSVWMHQCAVLPFIQKFIQQTKSSEWIRAFRAIDVS
ncbi:MAG: CRISPR-associated endonuclease Cas2 [bacterium]|nr:CRISPR-associated endonuclease Cas2 [bacterium]